MNQKIEREKLNKRNADEIIDMLKEFGSIFGILEGETGRKELPEEVKRLIEEREAARKKGDYQTSDEIRKKIRELGFILEDTPKGTRWKRA